MRRIAPLILLSLIACRPDEVDETGYLQPPEIDTTGEESLDEEESRPLLVVGTPGAVQVSGGSLTITASSGDSNTVQVADLMGAFVGIVFARKSDTIELQYEQDGTDSLVLGLEGTGLSLGPICATCIIEGLFVGPDAEGNVLVDLNALTDLAPPLTMLNVSKGLVVRTEATTGVLRIPAASGDSVCIYQSNLSLDQTSLSTCEDIR